jgi:hypothetical protein
MPVPHNLVSKAELISAIDAHERQIGRLLILADAQASMGRFELARQTRMLILLRQDELSRLRDGRPAHRT